MLKHLTLNATLQGIQSSHNNIPLQHYRGIRYATIPGRFKKATAIDTWDNADIDCTRFGPNCPQNYVDVGYLLRIPESQDDVLNIAQDEFDCLSINVTTPLAETTPPTTLLPVIVWIHGGSQVVSFPPPSHKVSDPSKIVSQSAAIGKPVIFVTFNYRLNIFAFGDGNEVNLALKDQRLAIDWVTKHIAGFGGDKDNITLCGESAGAVYAHAHLCTSAPVKCGILQSGSLYLSPPLPTTRGTAFITSIDQQLRERSGQGLKDAPVADVLRQLAISNVNTLYLQEEPQLKGWEDRLTDVPELLIGDVEFESVIWRAGVESMTASEITAAFTHPKDPTLSQALLQAYHISPTRLAASRAGALDFLTDARFAWPSRTIANARSADALKTFRYVFDQPSPFQASARAHHGVDLLYLFEAYSDTFLTEGQRILGNVVRDKWIAFANGEAPWNESNCFAFGPFGLSAEIDNSGLGERRRVKAWDVLEKTEPDELVRIFFSLAGGRISLLN
ncbi:alpha/beta-hydrolase [Mollisia scopiformis]|uniref:Carboxylic ester hydrolase n=1 Tax=Mollisia scopiformis TaxID=149040 RepID=A0A194WZH4_MOLSC|nr:alpha/beta-hydrolase [Mollisia scopiformis]KUJ13351.1 alpha/beta-hydrolase [Mollisia scopiformis]